MKDSLTKPADRLIVAADFDPSEGQGRVWVENKVVELAEALEGTDVYLKVNSALRAVGHDLVSIIHLHGLRVFADLKLNDIGNTLKTDGAFLREVNPDMLTVMCSTGVDAMSALRKVLPGVEILGVTVLTSLDDVACEYVYGTPVSPTVMRLARLAREAGIDGLIASPKEAEMLRILVGEEMTINTPAIRPLWSALKDDDQNLDRVMTPAKAIKAGADRIVVGRPIIQAKDPREAVEKTLEEIASALTSVSVP